MKTAGERNRGRVRTARPSLLQRALASRYNRGMSDELLSEVLALTPGQRAELAHRILESEQLGDFLEELRESAGPISRAELKNARSAWPKR